MDESLSKQLAEKPQLSPQEHAQSLPMPSTIDLSDKTSFLEDLKMFDSRVFKKQGSAFYPLPSEKEEFQRLDIQHYIVKSICQCVYHAPVTDDLKRGIKVIDVGCGTGVWSMELAAQFPNSTFVGTDIVNGFEVIAAKAPQNVSFLEADTLAGLPFEDNTFDYVFQRAQTSCFSAHKWPGVIKELMRVAKPGAYVELLEGCLPKGGGPAMTIHSDWFSRIMKLRDVEPELFSKPDLVVEAGLVNIVSKYYPWYYGLGPDRDLAKWSAKNWLPVFDLSRPQITATLGISDAEYTDVAERAKKELMEPKSEEQVIAAIYVHYGQKPAVEN